MVRLKRFMMALVLATLIYLWISWLTMESPKLTQTDNDYVNNMNQEFVSGELPCTLSKCHIGPMVLNDLQNSPNLEFQNENGIAVLQAELGVKFDTKSSYELQDYRYRGLVNVKLRDVTVAVLQRYKYRNSHCVKVSWRATRNVKQELMDCFRLDNAHWYGGSQLMRQLWPLEKVQLPMNPYLAITKKYGTIQERLFFNSKGGGIYVEDDIPLFVSVNASGDSRLCLQAKYDNRWYVSRDGSLPELSYIMCSALDVRTIHQLMSDRYIRKPSGTPSHDVFRYPIWSTWAQYKTSINQALVQEFVKDIKKHNFSIAQVEIDDGWSVGLGEMVFNHTSFPDPKGMIDWIHRQNVAVTLWVHPIIGRETKTFSFLARKGWMMQNVSGQNPAMTSWHKIPSGHIDFSNPSAAEWFSSQLSSLKKAFGIDSFKFDAGDVNILPSTFKAHKQFLNLNKYASLYMNVASKSETHQNRLEVRVGVGTQHIPSLVRLIDRYSSWTFKRGLKSLITTGLFFGIVGYPFVLPDYVGGNSYATKPDTELFIRWVQANALMPTMQFSLLPWASNNSTVLEVSQDMVKLHEKYSDLIIQLANQSVTTGYPIMRPLWWIAPTDESALTVDDQFLLGDDVLVAPVVEQGQTTRRIYLPDGRWRDESKGQVYDGGKWIDYPVTLRDLPYFTKVK